jgi:hypothetical protein
VEKLENINKSLEGISDNLENAVDVIYEQYATTEANLDRIAHILDSGFSQLCDYFDSQTQVLETICTVLENPRATKASELRRMADELQQRGLLPKAKEYYLASLGKNILDYRTYISLAGLCVRQGSLEEARVHVENSLPHAPKSNGFDWRSYSYRLLANISMRQNDPQGAINHLHSALTHTNDYHEAWFELAQFYAITSKKKGCVDALERAIILNHSNFAQAQCSNFFEAQPEVVALLERMYSKVEKEVIDDFARLERKMKRAFSAIATTQELLARAGKGTENLNLARKLVPSLAHHHKFEEAQEKGTLESLALYERIEDILEQRRQKSHTYASLLSDRAELQNVHNYIDCVIEMTRVEQQHFRYVRKTKFKDAWSAVPRGIFGYPILGALFGFMTGCIGSCTYEVITKSRPDPNAMDYSDYGLLGGPLLGAAIGFIVGLYEIKKKLK